MKLMRRILREERGDLDDLPGWTIMAVTFLAFIGIVFYVGRAGTAANTVQAAAYAAARDASISRTATEAIPHARSAAEVALQGNVNCTALDITIGGNGLSTGIGQTGTVDATVTCTVNTADLSIPFIPGQVTITKTATSPVDPYRQR